MIYYETKYTVRGKLRVYTTKSLTETHERLRRDFKPAMTCKCDTDIKWAFGVWSEVIAHSNATTETVQ